MDSAFFTWVEALLADLDGSTVPEEIHEAGAPARPNGRGCIDLHAYLLMYAVYLLEQIKTNTAS